VAAGEIDATEQKIRKLLDAGKPLAEARQELGYHSLQTRLEARNRRLPGHPARRRCGRSCRLVLWRSPQ